MSQIVNIIWSDDARSDYEENIKYLLSEWTAESAISFIEEVEVTLDLIKENPKLYPLIDYKSVRRAVVRKQITLFYTERNNTVYLVRFWNTFQNPDSLKL